MTQSPPKPEIWFAWVTFADYPRDKAIALIANLPIDKGGFRLLVMPKWMSSKLRARFKMNEVSAPRIVGFKDESEIPAYALGDSVDLNWEVRSLPSRGKPLSESVITIDGKVVYRATIAHQPPRRRRAG